MTNDTDAYELTLFAENDGDLYRSRIQPIVTNLARKIVLRTFDADKALTLWRYAADDAAQRYTREHGAPGPHGSYGSFSVATRKACAAMLAEGYADGIAEEAQAIVAKVRK
jgi:hypothetical protein